jgi:iron(II)-dependent oxidoreductase
MNEQAERIARVMTETRAQTLRLFDLADERDLHESPGFGYRPLIWHLAHIGVFESYWLWQKLRGLPAPDESYERIFDPIQTPREESKHLPTRREMEDYLRRVRAGVLESLDGFDFDSADPLKRGGYLFRLVLEHEQQHQETLAYLFQMLDPAKKTRPASSIFRAASSEMVSDAVSGMVSDAAGEMVSINAGSFQMGAVWDSFAYDNEYPAREVFVSRFKLARAPVTNDEYARFVEEGGYERHEFWNEEGWRWREKESWTCPLYWRRAGGWVERRMFEEAAPQVDHPVTGVSWYEAEAYARFAGKRLPTEAEWEKAASWDEARASKRRYAWGDAEPDDSRCNFGQHTWGTTRVGLFPSGASAYGCLDMTGNVWEWTATPFDGFDGFESFPYPEYSQEWFDGDHRVLKGGSWATHPSILRTSFRNFFRRHFRIAFAGFRLAEDA